MCTQNNMNFCLVFKQYEKYSRYFNSLLYACKHDCTVMSYDGFWEWYNWKIQSEKANETVISYSYNQGWKVIDELYIGKINILTCILVYILRKVKYLVFIYNKAMSEKSKN